MAHTQEPASNTRYSAVAIALHWAIALAMGGMIFLGENMHDKAGRPIEWMFQLHKSIGITILVLTIARISWRIMNPPPPLPDDMKPLEKTASHAVHIGFYGLMILLPLSGWLVVSLSPFAIATVLYGMVAWPHLPLLAELPLATREAIFPTVTETHHILSKALIALVILHVAGAIKHEFSDEEGVLKRMLPGLFGKAAAPQLPSRGAVTAFGSAALFFGVIACAPVAAKALSGQGDVPSAELAVQNWTVDYEASEIAFSGTYNGADFSGQFEDWTASISYNPNAPEAVSASVVVQTGSARTGDTLYDTTLEAAEWFNIGAFPAATLAIEGAEQGGDGSFTTTAEMTFKGIAVPVALTYTLSPEGEAVRMQGTATLSRKALDMGQDSDANGDWVSDAIAVAVTVVANPSAS